MKSARRVSGLLFAAGAVLSTCAISQPKSDWEIKMETRDWQEGEVKVPGYPKPENLVEFEASAASRFRFFIDTQSTVYHTSIIE